MTVRTASRGRAQTTAGALPRVLFVGHDASRTGAPAVGLAFLRWLVAGDRAGVSVRLLRDGPLTARHRALAPTTVARRRLAVPTARLATVASVGDHHGVMGRVTRAAAARALAGSGRDGRRPDVVVANTLAALGPAARLARGAPLVCWVHELDGVAQRLIPPARRPQLLAMVDRFVAAGASVEAMLVERWDVPRGRVRCVPDFVTMPQAPDPGPPEARRNLDMLGAGSVVPRKGVDAFLAVTAVLAKDRPGLRAAWVGDRHQASAYRAEVLGDLALEPLLGRVELVDEVSDLDPWWPTDGVFLHAAREDPSPLVVVEAGLRAVPVVTWETGGAADLLRSAGLGHLVAPAGDLLGLARRVTTLLDDPEARRRAGAALEIQAKRRTSGRLAAEVWKSCREAMA